MNYEFIGQLFEAIFAVLGVVVFVWSMWDFFAGETTNDPFDDHELDFIPKSLKKII